MKRTPEAKAFYNVQRRQRLGAATRTAISYITTAIRDRRVVGYITAGLIGLMIGYFAGREHLKYEMRSAFQSAAQEIQKGFTSAFLPEIRTRSTSQPATSSARI